MRVFFNFQKKGYLGIFQNMLNSMGKNYNLMVAFKSFRKNAFKSRNRLIKS